MESMAVYTNEFKQLVTKPKVFCRTLFHIFYLILHALIIWKSIMFLSGTESAIVVVLSGSMEPGIYRGDILLLSMWNEEQLRAGDIVVFSITGRNIPIVHRALNSHRAWIPLPSTTSTKDNISEIDNLNKNALVTNVIPSTVNHHDPQGPNYIPIQSLDYLWDEHKIDNTDLDFPHDTAEIKRMVSLLEEGGSEIDISLKLRMEKKIEKARRVAEKEYRMNNRNSNSNSGTGANTSKMSYYQYIQFLFNDFYLTITQNHPETVGNTNIALFGRYCNMLTDYVFNHLLGQPGIELRKAYRSFKLKFGHKLYLNNNPWLKNKNTLSMLTKGDNNSIDDRGLYNHSEGQLYITRGESIGRAYGYLPNIGLFTIFLNDYQWLKHLLIVCIMFFALIGRDSAIQ